MCQDVGNAYSHNATLRAMEQWLWLSWQIGHFWQQRSAVRFQSKANCTPMPWMALLKNNCINDITLREYIISYLSSHRIGSKWHCHQWLFENVIIKLNFVIPYWLMKLFLSFIKSFKNLHYLLILFFVWNLNFTTKLTFAKPERKKITSSWILQILSCDEML